MLQQVGLYTLILEVMLEKLLAVGAVFLAEVDHDAGLAGRLRLLQVFLQIEEAELEEIGEAQRLFQRLVIELQGINGIFEVVEIIGVRGPGHAAGQQHPQTDG